MNKKRFFLISILLVVFVISFSLNAQSIKIKPIVGKHSFSIQSVDVGYGIKKHFLCLERLPDNLTEFYLPSDINLQVEAVPFQELPNSGKVKINSQKTADGFLFIANCPQGNNLHFHLKKSASENSRYEMEVNFTKGNKYEYNIMWQTAIF